MMVDFVECVRSWSVLLLLLSERRGKEKRCISKKYVLVWLHLERKGEDKNKE
jgi:hypothetical protein